MTSKTHDTAIIEYSTDEPATGEVRFGTLDLDDFSNSGESRTKHKFILSNLDPATRYSYLVASTDASSNGPTESSMAVFTTDPEIDVTAPALGDPVIIYKNDESATVRWTADEESTGEVEFGTDAADLGFIRSLPETASQHEITLTNLEADTEYFYTVSSSDLSNNGPTESTVFSFTTDAVADLDGPEITNVQFEPADEEAVITWTTNELADSFVDFGTTSGLLDVSVGSVEDVLEHEVILTNLTAGTTYFFTAGSIDRANNQAPVGAELSFATLGAADLTPPAAPANLAATSGNAQATLGWDANTELDFASYTLSRRLSGEADFVVIASGLTEASYTDLGLVNDETYDYEVKAVDRNDNISTASNPQSVIPTATMAPSLVSDLSRSGEALTPTFVFTDATPFTAGASLTYTVQVSTLNDFSNVVDSESDIPAGAGGVDTGQTGWTITRELTDSETYFWRVRAVEGALVGAWTATQQFEAQAIVLEGDFDGNLAVNLDDFFAFASVFGQAAEGDNAKFDLDGDGQVDLDDFFEFANNFGTSVAAKHWAFAHFLDEQAHIQLEASGGGRTDDGGRAGTPIRVRVDADGVEEMTAFGLVIGYDPAAVRFTQASAGPGHLLESEGGEAPFFQVFRHTPGQLVIGNGLATGEPVSGHGPLAELVFATTTTGPTNDAFFDLRDAVIARDDGTVHRVARLSAAQLRPADFRLGANFPNPFNPTTSIDYDVPEAAPVELVIFDILGQKVKTLVADENHRAGFHTAVWDGTDSHHRPVGNGLYFYRFSAARFHHVGKMMLLK